MCGIVYSFRKDGQATSKRVLKRYGRQSDRGTDGFGYIALNDDMTVSEYKRFQDEEDVRAALKASDSKHVLFHHRFPTSTVNIPEAAHPIKVQHAELKHTYYLVHNGVISNPSLVKSYHDELGYKYQTLITTQYVAGKSTYYGTEAFNDSEALAVELARTIEGLQTGVRTTGSIAFILLQANKAGTKVQRMYYGTNGGNPLTLTNDEHGITIASEGGKRILDGIVYRQDFATGKLETVDIEIPAYQTYKSNYDYTYGGSAGKYKGYDYNKEKDEDSFIPSTYGARDVDEIEEALADARADLAIAKQAYDEGTGEADEIESLEIEIEALQEELMAWYAYGYGKEQTSSIGF